MVSWCVMVSPMSERRGSSKGKPLRQLARWLILFGHQVESASPGYHRWLTGRMGSLRSGPSRSVAIINSSSRCVWVCRSFLKRSEQEHVLATTMWVLDGTEACSPSTRGDWVHVWHSRAESACITFNESAESSWNERKPPGRAWVGLASALTKAAQATTFGTQHGAMITTTTKNKIYAKHHESATF